MMRNKEYLIQPEQGFIKPKTLSQNYPSVNFYDSLETQSILPTCISDDHNT